MRKDAALARLKGLEPSLRDQGVSALFLFGSVARDAAVDGSDVDIAFDVPRSRRFSLFDAARVQSQLADSLGQRVDLVAVEAFKPRVRAGLEAEMVRVF